ncbi:DUF1415 domain-containing protein [Accumulibacter sp.]|uniref:DUF1415 domain-containing protein n=1 Tax=Accumulibacter sp. TaxID=2053492 RepID=UPI0025F867D3|nr:DUF1415 domain-containing protein [Accumulibacter sp.]MCM8611346.1 DUF1415 domain-containing protein [Accumulibacter sp.]MCM8635007.1 DUF1415 domain-containing protein [Accumulibacter sp.]MCM8639795.1 DUF1415 domain-containing protein [Accumulibacter sp.]
MLSQTRPSHDEVIASTRHWLERAVIGLNLCPFAKGVHAKGQIRYVVSPAENDESLLDDLQLELLSLCATPADEVDTTLLIHPWVLTDFADFLRFLDLVDVVLQTHRLHGVLQVASFHPDYVFADSTVDDITNHTNRSPFPTLHLLREASLDRAVAAFPEAAMIYERNLQTLRQLGADGWQALAAGVSRAAKE